MKPADRDFSADACSQGAAHLPVGRHHQCQRRILGQPCRSPWRPVSREVIDEPIGLDWPPGVYSLSHIAVPFPISDPLYGLVPDESEFYGIRLGTLDLRGERNALRVSHRATDAASASNPFYPYLEQRALDWLDQGR